MGWGGRGGAKIVPGWMGFGIRRAGQWDGMGLSGVFQTIIFFGGFRAIWGVYIFFEHTGWLVGWGGGDDCVCKSPSWTDDACLVFECMNRRLYLYKPAVF